MSFEKIRASTTDSGVKGTKNEQTLARFVQNHTQATSVSQRIQVLDSKDRMSDELDIVALNEHQPFGQTHKELVPVEGVSFVIQVKAILTRDEIRRTVQNCVSFKQLRPWFGEGDTVYREFYGGLRPHWQSPYICFCYSSELKDSTILEQLTESSSQIDPDSQIDALFVLDRGFAIMNYKGGSPVFTSSSGEKIVGWGLTYSGDETLFEFLGFIHLAVPKILRINPPFHGYAGESLKSPRSGLFKYSDSSET